MRILLVLALAAGAAATAAAQRDFLTADEADQLRETASDPNARLKLYVAFARQRVDQIEQLVKDDRAGRAALMHELLEQYTGIIDAMDTVVDDALSRKVDVAAGIKLVADAEKQFLPVFERIEAASPKDLAQYEFALTQAKETTQDSLDAANEDLGKRTDEVVAREKREKEEIEALMQPKDREAKQAREQKEQAENKNKRKPPTLLKKGETVKKQ